MRAEGVASEVHRREGNVAHLESGRGVSVTGIDHEVGVVGGTVVQAVKMRVCLIRRSRREKLLKRVKSGRGEGGDIARGPNQARREASREALEGDLIVLAVEVEVDAERRARSVSGTEEEAVLGAEA
jgi:hypothetical protein